MRDDSTILLTSRTENLIGRPFGRLKVIAFVRYDRFRQPHWQCQCQCGNTVIVPSSKLRYKHTRSCGCLRRDVSRARHLTHGKSDSPEFRIWWGMLERCEDPRKKAYERYGARGITVCEAWHVFATFFADMGPRPTPQHSLERLKNDQGYFPDNCIWGTPSIQSRNTCRNNMLTYHGKTQCLEDWARETGLHRATILGRLRRWWTIEEALTRPPRSSRRQYKPS